MDFSDLEGSERIIFELIERGVLALEVAAKNTEFSPIEPMSADDLTEMEQRSAEHRQERADRLTREERKVAALERIATALESIEKDGITVFKASGG